MSFHTQALLMHLKKSSEPSHYQLEYISFDFYSISKSLSYLLHTYGHSLLNDFIVKL